VHKVSQVGAEQAHIELQVVILEWLGTAAILAVHLAQVSQVDRVQRQVVRGPSGLAGRLSKFVRIANQKSASELAAFLRSLCFKSAIKSANKSAKGAKRGLLALLEAASHFR
jgi:hypothetical protein